MSDPWDAFVAETPGGHHLQTSQWAAVKASVGFRAERVLVESDGSVAGGCQVLLRDVPLFGAVGYVPRGPLVAPGAPERTRAEVLDRLEELAVRERVSYLKVQPPTDGVPVETALRARAMRRSATQIAPVATVRVPVAGRTDEALLGAMRAMTRRNVRLSERRGVVVREGGEEDIAVLHRLLRATGERQGFPVFSLEYFQSMWRAFAAEDQVRLILAEHAGTPLAAAVLIGFGDSVIYKIGAWSGQRRDLRVNEALHWAGIRGARDAGYTYYDFDGIAPAVAEALLRGEEPSKAQMAGVTGFKLGFGGEVTRYPGTYDAAYRGMLGRGLRALAPRVERWRGLAQRLSGRG